MRRLERQAIVFWFVVVVIGAISAVVAKPKAQQAPGEDAVVLAADTALGGAMHAGDKSAARHLLSLEFTYVDENGRVHGRKEFLADLRGVAPAAAADVTVKIYGLVAIVTGKRKSALGNDTFFLDIWAKSKRAWRALTMQDVVLAADDAPRPGAESPEAMQARNEVAKPFDCRNPCETIPYRVRSPAEQDIVNTFQAVEKAAFDRDADEYGKHLAGEFVYYETDAAPLPRSERIARLEEAKQHNMAPILTAIQSMRLWVYGDGAAMISANGVPDDSEPLSRIARVWTKRNDQWQMVISVVTDVK